jgi:cation transport regulator ChaB
MDGDRLMPYDTLPKRLRDLIPSKDGQEMFRNVVNSQLAANKTEAVAMASAWAALERAGYDKGDDGKWVKKTMPTLSQVHVPGAEWDDKKRKKKPKVEKAEYQGRIVSLDKPFRMPKGSSKKFGVYVKDGDRVKRVTFGDPNMEIRRDDAQARANFRSRHSCDTATDKTSARYWSCRMWTAKTPVSDLAKRYLNDDSFTTREEAAARSYDLGLEGEIHVHQTADGQAVYMPGESHEDYLEAMASAAGLLEPEEIEEEEYEDESGTGLLERAISAILEAVTDMEKADMTEDVTKTADILKVDTERRIAWGWASVSTMKGELVTDLQGDTITPQEMEKMADRFMASARTAKAMHQGDQIGEVLHSFPITNEIAKAFGMETDREGWIIGMKIHDDAVWQGFKDGTYKAFSIGGRSKRERIA